MGKNETALTDKMRSDAMSLYGDRLVIVKYHGNEYSRSGVSDLLGCLDGAFWACEVKSPKSHGGSVEKALNDGPTVLQQAFIGHVLDAGGVAWVAATREQFLEGLADLDAMSRDGCVYCQHPEEYVAIQHCPIHPVNTLTSIEH